MLFEFLYDPAADCVARVHEQRLKRWANIVDKLAKAIIFDNRESDVHAHDPANKKIPEAICLHR